MDWDQTLTELVERARRLVTSDGRRVLGIVGPPGGGKSTIAEAVVDQLGPVACYVPMDGFHLANVQLDRLGRRSRKGAPDTFDAAGYVALLRRVLTAGREEVYAPSFDRELDEPVAAAIAIPAQAALIVTEGNYLLLDSGAWADVRPLLDEVWYVDGDEDARLEQLVRRHVAFGKHPDAARAWALGTDQRNAELVAATRSMADHVVYVDFPPAAPAQARLMPGATGTSQRSLRGSGDSLARRSARPDRQSPPEPPGQRRGCGEKPHYLTSNEEEGGD